MNTRISLRRRVATAIALRASHLLGSARASWAEAVCHEVDHIESDGEAMTWALGCLLAACVERSRAANLLQTWYVRALLTVLIAAQVLSFLFATVLTASYRLHFLALVTFLGAFTPGDDYHRFIPLMNATPWWIHALWVSASALFFVSAWQLLRRHPSAFLMFASAWLLGAIGNLISQSIPAYRQAFSFPAPLFTRDYLIPAVTALIPMFIAITLWAHRRLTTDKLRQA